MDGICSLFAKFNSISVSLTVMVMGTLLFRVYRHLVCLHSALSAEPMPARYRVSQAVRHLRDKALMHIVCQVRPTLAVDLPHPTTPRARDVYISTRNKSRKEVAAQISNMEMTRPLFSTIQCVGNSYKHI